MRTVQKYLYYLLFFLTPFIMYSGTSELFEFNKIIFIYLITSGILCVWLMRSIKEGRILFKRTPFDIFIGLFFLSQVLSTLFSIDVHTSLFGYYGRFNGGLISLITYLILYYSLASFLDESKSERESFIKRLLIISVVTSALVILWGIPGKLGHDLSCVVFSGKFDNSCWTAQFDPAARMFSTLGQPNWFGSYIAITFFICLYFYLRSTKYKYIYLSILLFNLVAVFFSNSRSSLVATIVTSFGVGVVVLFLRKQLAINSLFKKTVPLMVGLFIFVLLFKTGVSQIDRYLDFSNYFKKQVIQKQVPIKNPSTSPNKISDSIDIRKIVWKGATNLGLQYPLFGTGVETFAYSYYFVRPQEHNLTSEWDYLYNKAHNEYLNFFATTGFFGIASYVFFLSAVIVLTLVWIIRSASLLQVCLLASWITILITNFVGFSTTVINLYFYIIPLLIYYLEVSKKNEKNVVEKHTQPFKKEQGGNAVWYGCVLLLLLFLFQYFISYWIADTKFALGENAARSNDYQTAVSLITSALQFHPEHVYEDKLSFYLASLAVYQKDPKEAVQLMKSAQDYNNQSLHESPQNILYWKTRIKNLYLFYQITLDKKYLDEGIQALNEARKISPTDPKLTYFSATYYALMYDEEKNLDMKKNYAQQSLLAINESIRMKNDYFESYFLKAQLLKKYQMKVEAKQVYEYILKNISPQNAQVIQDMQGL